MHQIAALLSEVAEREYPVNWPTFIDELKQVWAIGESQAEICIMVLTSNTLYILYTYIYIFIY
jgi:Exportin 1-like protein